MEEKDIYLKMPGILLTAAEVLMSLSKGGNMLPNPHSLRRSGKRPPPISADAYALLKAIANRTGEGLAEVLARALEAIAEESDRTEKEV